MDAFTPPPLIPCCTETDDGMGLDERAFRMLFRYLYMRGHWYISQPEITKAHKVRFSKEDFNHYFYKAPENSKSKERTVWQPSRAARILWIGFTVENPSQIYKVGESRLTMFTRMRDQFGWYVVVVDRSTRPCEVFFVTAYPLDHESYLRQRKTGDLVWSQ